MLSSLLMKSLATRAQVMPTRSMSGAENSPFPPGEMNHYKSLFSKYDDNRDAHLDRWEFNNLVRHLVGRPYPTTDLDKVFKTIDASKDQLVNYEEYIRHVIKNYHPQTRLSMEKVFNNCDKNGDGRLGWNEARQALRAVGRDADGTDLHRKFRKSDANRDDHLTYSEFTNLVRQTRSKLK